MVTLEDYHSDDPIAWCPGCGNFSILEALKNALVQLGKRPNEIVIVSGIIGSRGVYVLMNISYYRYEPAEIFKIWQGGLVFSGGIIGAVLAGIWYAKHHKLPLWKLCDMWAPAAAIGQSIGRIGCFMAGCCYGKPTDLNWGVVFTHPKSLAPLNVPLHPTQIYSFLSGLIIFLILLLIYSKKKLY